MTASLTGCLYSVHHFNTGEVMPAGRSRATAGLGRQPLWHCRQPHNDTAAAPHACGEIDSLEESVSKSDVAKGSLDFRLGLKDAWGPFTGVEMQWHLEAPTNPATMEFGLNLGLPSGLRPFRHELGAGWGIGAWADNSFYLEDAASWSAGPHLVFGNVRVTWLATQIEDVLQDDFSAALPSKRRLILQAGAGLYIRLPGWRLLPDYLIPHVSATFPQLTSGDQRFLRRDIPAAQWDANLGFAWGL